ncbi:Protein toll [Chionoecetes opilio]|uniref:Protein toll n=1 Tax=Chionoecetes opilio TaxID=41210 RepID=A0A8J4Y4I5_CHIOP|nr:Protein toll [Chionoecetes opilio]
MEEPMWESRVVRGGSDAGSEVTSVQTLTFVATMSQQKCYVIAPVWVWLLMAAVGCVLCGEADQQSITCLSTPDKQVNFSVKVLPKGEIHLQCLHLTHADYSLMDGCEFKSVTHTEFHGCSLPNSSYKEVLQNIGVNPEDITSLTLSNVSRKGVLTEQHLQGLDNLQVLRVTGIQSVTSDAFRSTPRLETLEISNSNISQLTADLLYNMTNLRNIMLHHNRLEELPTKLFSGAPGLHTLHLHDNLITVLQEDLFKGLKSLKTLNVSKNKLETLFSGLFSDNTLMESLDISENMLSDIETRVFANMQVLRMLNLGHNRLRALPEAAFQGCRSLEKLELNNNNLSHASIKNVFPKVSSLVYIDLGHNNIDITSMRNFALNNQHKLQYLYLNNNNISVLPESLGYVYVNLKTVDLSRNSFEYLDFRSLIFQSNLVKLNFKFNKINTIDFMWGFLLQPPKKKVKLALEGNPLSCDCYNYGFFRVVQDKTFERINNTLEVIVEDSDQTFCQFPNGKQENVLEVQTETLTCQVENVDDDCAYAYRAHDQMGLIDCSHLKLESIQSLNLTRYSQQNFTLILANNRLTSLAGLQNYTHLRNLTVPHNKLSFFNVSHLPPNLTALDVRGNNLTTLSSVILHHLNTTDMSLRLGGNPWRCDCDLLDLFRFLHVPSRKVIDFRELQCEEDGQPLMDLSEHDLCPFFMQPMVIVTIVATLIFLSLFAILGTVSFYKYKQGIKVWLYAHHLCLWAITEDELDADKKYDAFISYSHKDEEFVTKQLVPGLECGDPKYRVCLHYRDWVPGEYIQNQIMKSVDASRRTIVVLSSSFLESVWGKLEFRAAHSQALQDHTNRIIVIVYGKHLCGDVRHIRSLTFSPPESITYYFYVVVPVRAVPMPLSEENGKVCALIPPEKDLDEELKLYISTKSYVQWGDNKFWEKLRYIMPHPPDLVRKKRTHWITDKLELCKSDPKQSVC